MSDLELPSRIPVFPLPNVVLFPDTSLPLHVFEPRYRAMTQAALDGDRVIGMVLLKPPTRVDEGRSPIYEIGCAGPIGSLQRLPDGRFNLLLSGVRRFRVLGEERGDEPYRIARIELLPDPDYDDLTPAIRAELDPLGDAIAGQLLSLARDVSPESVGTIQERLSELDPVRLVHAAAFGVESDPLEKQGLLEAPDPLARATLLHKLLEFRLAAGGLPEPPRTLN